MIKLSQSFLSNPPSHRPFVPVRALFCAAALIIMLSTPILPADSLKTAFVTGAHLNQNRLFGMLGVAVPTFPRTLAYIGTDLGGVEKSGTAAILYQIWTPGRFRLFALFGSSLEKVLTESAPLETTSFLGAASGILLSYKFNSGFSAFVALSYLTNNALPVQYKIAAGFSFPFARDS